MALSAFVAIFLPAVFSSVSASPTFTEYPTPTASAFPLGIAPGSDGALWYVDNNSNVNRIGRITTSGVSQEYSIPTNSSHPYSITSGPDGALWFTENSVNKIGRITTSGTVTEYALPTESRPAGPQDITTGPDGALWFTDGYYIGRIDTEGNVTIYPIFYDLWGIASGSDGALWFIVSGSNQIGRIDTAGNVTWFQTSLQGLNEITAGPDGALWFTAIYSNSIGRITTSGVVTEYPVPTPNAAPWAITTGPDGALWFTEQSANQIGRVTISGVVTEYPVPTPNANLHYLTSGPDGALWFTEATASQIGRLSLAPSAPTNLSAPSPAQTPSLTWQEVPGASAYNIYRDGAKIGVTADLSFTDNAAPEGTDSYYVTATDPGGIESSPSNSVSILVDRTAPTITYSVSPAANSNGWNNSAVTVTFTCADNTGGSGIAPVRPR